MILQIWGATAGGAARNSQLASVTGAMAAMGLCATGGGQMGAAEEYAAEGGALFRSLSSLQELGPADCVPAGQAARESISELYMRA